MAQSEGATLLSLNFIALDPTSEEPLRSQLYRAIREAIVDGRLTRGARLPATRELCRELEISRNTVLAAFDQLMAEGYLQSQHGSGTRIHRELPDDLLRVPRFRARPLLERRDTRESSWIGDASPPQPLRPCVPSLEEFPFETWERLRRQALKTGTPALFHYGDPRGYAPLRRAIASYLNDARGVKCDAEQVVITAGSQEAIFIASSALLAPFDAVWHEEPGYLGARAVFERLRATIHRMHVSDQGANPPAMERGPRLIYLTPSHQFPTGVCMSLSRRMHFLELAEREGCYILEDDYDSEFRYEGRPLPSLQGLDTKGRVIYAGTFSKVLFPSLRLGYLVVPDNLLGSIVRTRAALDAHPPAIDQATTALFIEEGHFARHIRRMRRIYGSRLEFLRQHLPVEPSASGMHALLLLPRGVDDEEMSIALSREGIEVPPLSHYTSLRPERGGLVLGFAAYSEEEIREAAQKISFRLQI